MAKKKEKPDKKAFRVLKIIKNSVCAVALVALVCLVMFTLIARVNGETPKLFGYSVYRVSSGSMVPALEVGDIILCRECDPMELEEGDIITYNGTSGQFAGKKVTHRVVTAPYRDENDGEYYLLTKGDDNPVEDTRITVSQVTGKYLHKLAWLKNIYNFFLTPWGLLTIIALILLAFSNEIVIFTKAATGRDDEQEEDIGEIIDRIQRESAEEAAAEQAKRSREQEDTILDEQDSNDERTDCSAPSDFADNNEE